MSGGLRCYSFHSVKGGVGKSTLSVLTALTLARRPRTRVTLIDMDLTGTSLADALPLEAPAWELEDLTAPLPLLQLPTRHHSLEKTRELMEERDVLIREALDRDPDGAEARAARGVPFLNDYLLFATPDWDEERDLPIESMLWRMEGQPFESLRVVPSSALPADLERIIPVVFDENHAGFLEARLEYLLDKLVPDEGEATIVVDTPPTIPGLSRSVLSLSLRLSREEKTPLSEDGGMPERLADARIKWTAFLVSSMDRQDLRAAARWLSLVRDEEHPPIQFLINRARTGDGLQLEDLLRKALGDETNPLLTSPLWVKEERSLELFRSERLGDIPEDVLPFLRGEVGP